MVNTESCRMRIQRPSIRETVGHSLAQQVRRHIKKREPDSDKRETKRQRDKDRKSGVGS